MNGLPSPWRNHCNFQETQCLKKGVILLSSWMIVWNDWLGFWLYNIIKCVITWGRSSPQRFCSCSSWSHKFSVAQHSHIQYRRTWWDYRPAFWDHAPISLLFFTSIFNESLATSVIPTSFKKSVIIPVPKNSKTLLPEWLSSSCPHINSHEGFERLLKKHICTSIPATLDPLQFAYRPNRSTDDAISQVLHSSLTHIDSKNGNYVQTAIHWL